VDVGTSIALNEGGEINTLQNAGVGGTSMVASPAKIGVALQARALDAGPSGTVTISEDVPNNLTLIDVDTSGLASWQQDEFTPTLGQVTFILSSAPTNPTSVELYVNGVLYDDVGDYTISGQTITWLDTNFTMETTDQVIIRYK
jgi:hypothetical protein